MLLPRRVQHEQGQEQEDMQSIGFRQRYDDASTWSSRFLFDKAEIGG
jgi:hypothetical protein